MLTALSTNPRKRSNTHTQVYSGNARSMTELINPDRIRGAWAGRISGCLLGKPLEILSFKEGHEGIEAYLRHAGAWPLAGYVPLIEGTIVADRASSCREKLERAEADDDINYTILALLLLETHGFGFDRADVARQWLNLLPAGTTWTAERAAYRCLLDNMDDEFVNGGEPGFDLALCSENEFNDWIGAQIRADLYGWVCPGRPEQAAELASRDAALSHRGEGIYGAAFIAALGAAIPAAPDLYEAILVALEQLPADSEVSRAVRIGVDAVAETDGMQAIRESYEGVSPVHTVNNLALVIWALVGADGDFESAIVRAATAGWDTDSNAATVGGLAGLANAGVEDKWTAPWAGRVATNLGGYAEFQLDDLVERTMAVARAIGTDS